MNAYGGRTHSPPSIRIRAVLGGGGGSTMGADIPSAKHPMTRHTAGIHATRILEELSATWRWSLIVAIPMDAPRGSADTPDREARGGCSSGRVGPYRHGGRRRRCFPTADSLRAPNALSDRE